VNALLQQFLSEAREFLQGIGEKLMALEQKPDDADLMIGLFRLVHTLKGNSGLFDFPEITRVLHAGEDLMDAVRQHKVAYSQDLADQLLDAMDYVGMLCDEIDSTGRINANRADESVRLTTALRALLLTHAALETPKSQLPTTNAPAFAALQPAPFQPSQLMLAEVAESIRLAAFLRAMNGEALHWLSYTPSEECFFQGDDPFFNLLQTPDVFWRKISTRQAWPKLEELDAYHCVLVFDLLSAAPHEELIEQYRYVPDQVRIAKVDPWLLVTPQGKPNGGPVYEDFVSDALQHLEVGNIAALKQAAQTMLHLSNPDLWLSSALRWLLLLIDKVPDQPLALRQLVDSLLTLTPPDWAAQILVSDNLPMSSSITPTLALLPEVDAAAFNAILASQRKILTLNDQAAWQAGRLEAVAAVLINCFKASGDLSAQSQIENALLHALEANSGTPLLVWLDVRQAAQLEPTQEVATASAQTAQALITPNFSDFPAASIALSPSTPSAPEDEAIKFNRRAEDGKTSNQHLKVEQSKIDLLMSLIGEMVVAKNALPYLAQRAEDHFGVRELAREIKAQHTVINRIAQEMQGAIMQVRMMPVSFVFQRFPRLVRDISRKLGKDVKLVLEGEETQADKNIIESLADPLMHIVRNSLDHGLETPKVRQAAGKSASGTLTIRAIQEGDQALIEIIDDGKGIDPAVIKQKAFEKGLIDAATLARISDREAVNLVFAAGFSTAEVVTDLSGRGVGMDVVRTAVEKVNGTIVLESEVGKGTRIRISLPLSMAVTKIMIVKSDKQIFGVPMDHVVETVRVPCSAIRTIKRSKTIVLRGGIVPLKTLNELLMIASEPQANADNEMAVLVVRVAGEAVGLIVDDFRETVDVIQKPLSGVLAGLSAYSGSALMGDGAVLMVINVKELL
jgi:two-component system chemotaxis sensor kinase CheA